jgi:two-component system, chemotaxis family, sensor kinase CheA
MDELLDQFLIEGRELVQLAADDLLALERDPADMARIDSVFRAVHTLKGSAGLFDFAPMTRALHAAEDLLGAVRARRLAAGRGVIDTLLACISATEAWFASITRTGGLPASAAEESEGLCIALRAPLASLEHTAADVPVSNRAWLPALLARAWATLPDGDLAKTAVTAVGYTPAADCFFLGDDPMALARSIPGLLYLHIAAREPWRLEDFDPFACNLRFEALSTAPAADVKQVFQFVPDQIELLTLRKTDFGADRSDRPETGDVADDVALRTLRVDASRIDALVDLVGELIVAKNGLAHLVAQAAATDPALARALSASQAEIERLAAAMHRAAMGVRMLPLERTFRRLPRLVRDIAAALGRELVFEVSGGEVKADKSIVDALFEPLLHVLRNAVDHGIEPAAARRAAGKPEAGRITLKAERGGDQIVIAVSDDGAGVDPARIRAAARARGLLSDAAIDALTDQQAIQLIFTPGFSTAHAITDISGRGVGLDSVRASVAALGGSVALSSEAGAGSTVSVSLPQAVSVSSIMIVQVGTELFGLPMDVVAEITRVPAARILRIRDGEAFVLRDRTVPLLRLSALLHIEAAPRGSTDARVLIVALGAHRVGVEVDSLGARTDVMLRPLTGLLARMPGVLGAALLGDGRVLLVLDLPELIG